MYNSFDLIEKLYFVRTSGSKEELKAAKIIQKECAKFNVKAKLESFPVDAFEVEKYQLHFMEPDMDVPFVAVGMSGSTPDKGVEGELVYVTSPEDAMISDLKDKICLIANKMVDNKTYKILAQKKPAALILCTGDVYLDEKDVDLDPYKYRKRHQDLAYIPAVCIRMKDAEKLVEHLPKKAHVTLKQKQFKTDSHNVVAEIKGTDKADEIIVYTAHYDSVSYSKGAYDNATGSACILEMLGYYSEHKPKRTVRFVWCGSEEEGLLGSRAYVEKHKKQLDKIVLNINVDMLGVTLGKDIACVSANEDLVHYLQYLSKMEGFPMEVRQGVYSSDSTPFADAGVPALSFARLPAKGGAVIHSRKDVMDHLSADNYYKSCGFIETFSDHMIGSVCFPVPREIPDKVKEDLDYYNLRKERK
ncbi:MAG: M28 family peptidase [Erysipelotrichaceae bacterium]|nr:M28 family peptidase [Erysipelotrichaceae bacterium]